MSRPTREQVAAALSTQTTCDGRPHPSELHYRQADAVLALFPDPSTGDAEAEAERRWPDAASSALAYPVNALREFARSGFLAGATWQAQQPRETVTTAADAWDEGFNRAHEQHYAEDLRLGRRTPAVNCTNPYRPEETP